MHKLHSLHIRGQQQSLTHSQCSLGFLCSLNALFRWFQITSYVNSKIFLNCYSLELSCIFRS